MFLPTEKIFTLYVPGKTLRETLSMPPGTAVVGRPIQGMTSRIAIGYEGNLYGASNLKRFEERVRHAASREAHNAPTVARAFVNAAELTEIGSYNLDTGTLTIQRQDLLDRWMGEPKDS